MPLKFCQISLKLRVVTFYEKKNDILESPYSCFEQVLCRQIIFNPANNENAKTMSVTLSGVFIVNFKHISHHFLVFHC